MTRLDPVDVHVLSALAELGTVAVHELAARTGIDPREIAYRLVGLSASGLPLVVGVECDSQRLRYALDAHAYADPAGRPASPTHPAQRPRQQQQHAQQDLPAWAQPHSHQGQEDVTLRTWGPPQSASWARTDVVQGTNREAHT